MIEQLNISGFRGLANFEMANLGRVNLLVGKNNSGKSTVLEAIELLCSVDNPLSLWDLSIRRGEWMGDGSERYPEVAISHLFTGHQIKPDGEFHIRGLDSSKERLVRASIVKRSDSEDQATLFDPAGDDDRLLDSSTLGLRLQWSESEYGALNLPLSSEGALSSRQILRSRTGFSGEKAPSVQVIGTSALSSKQVTDLFQSVVLTPEEELIVEVLRIIEPDIERIAAITVENRSANNRLIQSERGGIVVKRRGVQQRLPIGSMGDGMWRLLGLALAVVKARGGVLLVDEIDTGLHYSVMSNMWSMLCKTAANLNVQIFATTHSRDCYESLAAITHEDRLRENNVTIQRIEPDKREAVAFTEPEIVIAADRGIEIR